jgi:hypothetical protein
MSPQRLLCPLWHESLAQPLTSWVSGRPDHGRFVYGSAGLPEHTSRAHRRIIVGTSTGKHGEKPAKVPTVLEFRKVRFMGPGARSYGFRFVA